MSESLSPQAEFEAALGAPLPKEDQWKEYKTSIFVAPGEHSPGAKQMKTIASTLAAFMNAEGGILFIGVTDNYQASGIESDLKVLEYSSSQVKLVTERKSDKGYTYKGTVDHYELKLRAIVQAFLSDNARECISGIKFYNVNGKCVCRVVCLPCKAGEWVYSYDARMNEVTHRMEKVSDIYVRSGNQKLLLKGEARDVFIKARVEQGIALQLERFGSENVSEVMQSVQEMLSRLKGRHITGSVVTVSGGLPFTEEAVTATKKPKSLAWDGQHYTDVDGWKDLILKVLLKVQEVNSVAFDQMAERAEFSRHLITIQKPREKHSDCFTEKFGSQGNIRIKASLGNKAYLWREDYALRKILAFAEIDVSRFLFTAE